MKFFQKSLYIAGIIGTTLFYGCSDKRQSVNQLPSKNLYSANEATLRNANDIIVDEVLITIGKKYDIYVDGKEVATVDGKNWNWWTDKFILKTLDGKVLDTEQENKRIVTLNRSAGFYDGDGNYTGHIEEHNWKDLLNLSHIFHIYDKNDQEVGRTAKKPFRIFDKIVLYNNKGEISYVTKQKFKLLTDKYEIKVVKRYSGIDVEKVIMLTCIEDAIKDAESAKSNSDDVNKTMHNNPDSVKSIDSSKSKYRHFK